MGACGGSLDLILQFTHFLQAQRCETGSHPSAYFLLGINPFVTSGITTPSVRPAVATASLLALDLQLCLVEFCISRAWHSARHVVGPCLVDVLGVELIWTEAEEWRCAGVLRPGEVRGVADTDGAFAENQPTLVESFVCFLPIEVSPELQEVGL